jgi:hypothetical protein
MMFALTYLPDFVTTVLRGMPNVWCGRYRFP